MIFLLFFIGGVIFTYFGVVNLFAIKNGVDVGSDVIVFILSLLGIILGPVAIFSAYSTAFTDGSTTDLIFAVLSLIAIVIGIGFAIWYFWLKK